MTVVLNTQEITGNAVKKLPLCPKCKIEVAYRVKRGYLFKTLFSWLPVRRYYCQKCDQKHYVWH